MADTEDLETSRLIAQLALEDLEQTTRYYWRDPARQQELLVQREYWETFIRSIDEHESVVKNQREDGQAAAAGSGSSRSDSIDLGSVAALGSLEAQLSREPDVDERSSRALVQSPVAGPSTTKQSIPRPTLSCIACTDPIVDKHYVNSCGHIYCPTCVCSLIRSCTRDETLYPPRCCNDPFDIQHLQIQLLIPLDVYAEFIVKRREYETPADKRAYCPTPTCSRFLGASDRDKGNFRCKGCRTLVCSLCWGEAHQGQLCPDNDEGMHLVKAMAERAKWQTCQRCNAIVELNQGCFHITCRCRAEFCYLCGVRWKNCTCPQWDENRIIYAAEERVEAEVALRQDANPGLGVREEEEEREERVREAVEVLRNNVDCPEHIWVEFGGGSMCEMCRLYSPYHTFICSNCGTRVCGRCRFNRA